MEPPINVAFDPDMSTNQADWTLGRLAFETWRRLTVNDQRDWFALTPSERSAWAYVVHEVVARWEKEDNERRD